MASLVVRGKVSIVLPRWQAQRVGGEYFSSLLVWPDSGSASRFSGSRESFLLRLDPVVAAGRFQSDRLMGSLNTSAGGRTKAVALSIGALQAMIVSNSLGPSSFCNHDCRRRQRCSAIASTAVVPSPSLVPSASGVTSGDGTTPSNVQPTRPKSRVAVARSSKVSAIQHR